MLLYKKHNRISWPTNGFVMRFVVEATGFEPTTSASRRVGEKPFSLRMAFYSRFRSMANPLRWFCIRCFRVFQSCLWSDMWSFLIKAARALPPIYDIIIA